MISLLSSVYPVSPAHFNNFVPLQCSFATNYQIFMLLFSVRSFASAVKMSENLLSVDFEVFGMVQGVFFRKCTQDQAKSLGLRGWCKNTPEGTVQGQVEGPVKELQIMKEWLTKTGSTQSKIEKTVFKNEKHINEYSFKDFDIIRRAR